MHKQFSKAERLYNRTRAQKWRSKNPDKVREINKRYREKRRLRLLREEREAKRKAKEGRSS